MINNVLKKQNQNKFDQICIFTLGIPMHTCQSVLKKKMHGRT